MILNSEVEFLKRISVEEQRALKDDQFLPGRQIAFMIYEHFLATGAYESVQGLSDFFHFYVSRMMMSQISASDGIKHCDEQTNNFSDTVPGRIVQVKITRFCAITNCIGSV